jgi:lipopolysaccharide exporter
MSNTTSIPMGNLGKASVSAVKWSAVSTAGRFALQLIAQVVLARILGPENYGLFGIGMIVYTFGNFFASFGFGRNLMQQAEISNEDIRFAFTWQLITGSTATIAIYLLAPSLAIYFNEPRVQPVIEWLSLACLLNSATAPASNLLQRDLNFKASGLVQVASYALGYLVVGIPLALNGYGVNALVAAWLVQLSSLMIASYALRPHPLKPLFWFPGSREAFSFGGVVFVTNIINWILNNIDRVVIGRVINAQAVGLYTAGYNLATMPNTLLLNTLQTVLFASSAKLQSDPKRLAAGYLQIFATIWVVLLPVFVFLACMAHTIVALLYGPLWSDTAWVLAALFLGMPAFITWGLSTPILWNTGRKHQEFMLQLPIIVIGGILLFSFAGQGIHTVALITVGILFMRGALIACAALKALDIRLTEILPILLRGSALSCLAAVAAYGGLYLTRSFSQAVIPLGVSSVLACAIFLLIVLKQPALLGKDAQQMLNRFLPKLKQAAAS